MYLIIILARIWAKLSTKRYHESFWAYNTKQFKLNSVKLRTKHLFFQSIGNNIEFNAVKRVPRHFKQDLDRVFISLPVPRRKLSAKEHPADGWEGLRSNFMSSFSPYNFNPVGQLLISSCEGNQGINKAFFTRSVLICFSPIWKKKTIKHC